MCSSEVRSQAHYQQQTVGFSRAEGHTEMVHSDWITSPVQSARVKVSLLWCIVQHSKSLAVKLLHSLVGWAGRDRYLLSGGWRLEKAVVFRYFRPLGQFFRGICSG